MACWLISPLLGREVLVRYKGGMLVQQGYVVKFRMQETGISAIQQAKSVIYAFGFYNVKS